MSRELAELITLRDETPARIGATDTSHDGAELYRFADETEVVVTNAGLVTEDADGFAELRAACIG